MKVGHGWKSPHWQQAAGYECDKTKKGKEEVGEMGGRSGGWGGWGGMQSQHCSLRWVGEKGQHLGNRSWDSKSFCIANSN